MRTVSALCCLLAVSLFMCGGSVTAKQMHFGKCALNLHLHNLREHFNEMDSFIPQGDSSIALLDRDALNDIKPAESCCFLRQVLVFYQRSVFSHYTSKHPIVKRRCSSLANSFFSIEKPLTECHRRMMCHCGEETRLKMKELQSTYDKLDAHAAPEKAISEIQILLSWMEKPHDY
ncbi:interleukin-20-like [Polyodon spathula]|uniref:interleukin-20-like n=1 Tax=Polyodon spathula TaxID=7913 RepID=UPI001B7F2E98|nr:interleukin-20-like [Polyodon spathula]